MPASQQSPEELQDRLEELLDAGDTESLGTLARELHASDVADIVEALDEPEEQIRFLATLPVELASEALAEMEEGDDRAELLASLEPARGAELLHELADDDAADLIGELEPEERQRILEELPVDEAGDLRGLLLYDEESAGGLMTTDLVSVGVSLTAGEAIERVRVQGREVEDFYTVFVVDERRRLVGTVRLDDLVIADPRGPVSDLVEPLVASVRPDVDQEDVGRIIARYNLAALPVVNEFEVLLGRITFDDVIDVMEAEQTEDILRMAGLGGDEEALRYTWTESVRARVPWLFANLLTAALAASVVYAFSETIENAVILAAIMPIIAGLGGNAGTQALAITVRTLALEGGGAPRRPVVDIVGRELTVGLVNGAVVGSVVALLAAVVGGVPALGLVVFLAMWGNVVVAGFLGSFVPSVLDRLGVDPAVASSMFVTPFTDLCGFLFLLGLASRMLL